MTAYLSHPILLAAAAGHGEQRAIIFFAQILLLIVVGRLLGEWMQRISQPAVIGQLLAGIILGPSVFGSIWPAGQHALFPTAAADRQMLNAVSELGVLMLLLLTGMETDMSLVKRMRRTAAFTSAAGIIIPFACGYALGEMLPSGLLPDPNKRLITSLFLATALSISSVKIVAAVLREVDFLRRNLGQVILAAAILDDTIGWTILAVIGGLALHGQVVLLPLLGNILGTAAFLVFCFTIGGRWVARIIRWTNDYFTIEVPVISLILVIMIALALVTDFIGVHTVLGAFAAGIMVGQSPILTKHIEETLRGLIIALFMPVFFGVAGLSIDLKVLGDPHLLGVALLLIAIASFGKLGGCYLGARLGRLNHAEGLAVGFAMNARGSTEVILATVGLSIGALNQFLFTIIVVMAVVTTLIMPPLLRWALARVPIREEEKARLETEAAEEKDRMPKIERVLVGLDAGDNGQLASRLAGWLIGARHITATVIDVGGSKKDAITGSSVSQTVIEAAKAAVQTMNAGQKPMTVSEVKTQPPNTGNPPKKGSGIERVPIRELVSILPSKIREGATENDPSQSILEEAKKGYGLLFLGLGEPMNAGARKFPAAIEKIAREFAGPMAIVLHCSGCQALGGTPLEKILVPTTGADYSRFGAEVAVAIAKGCGAAITALNVSHPPAENELLRRPGQVRRTGRTLLRDIVALGKREGIRVISYARAGAAKESAILREAKAGGHQLIVLGTKARSGDELHFGQSVAALIESAPCPILIVKS